MRPHAKAPRIFIRIILAVLLAASSGFKAAESGHRFSFPRDHFCHPDYRTEWWYFTGHLEADGGKRFGYQLTFFRSALKGAEGADSTRQIYFAHFALTDISGGRFHFFERMNRGGLGIAGAMTDKLQVWNGDWLLTGKDGPGRIKAGQDGFGIDLKLSAQRPPVVHGKGGISRKGRGPGNASHYYSVTRLATRGTLTLEGAPLQVRGMTWMDHEFSTSSLEEGQTGWDWLSARLDDGTDLMLYVIRRADGRPDPWGTSGTLVTPEGRQVHLRPDDFTLKPTGTWKSPRSGATYPSGWEVSLPSKGMRLVVQPEVKDQELRTGQRITYWEGACSVSGTNGGKRVKGEGYVELTGYAGKLRF